MWDKILEYAATRGIEIVRTFADEGKSGLSIGGRAALQKLIADVEAGTVDFNVILVYDAICPCAWVCCMISSSPRT
jgi:DNA invertase Pin-like site-specific DNA recombinase